MNYLAILGGSVMVLLGIYLISLPIITLLKKEMAVRYFSSFASSARAHYLEQVLRLIVGWSMLSFSPSMLFAQFFEMFAWILIVSTVVLIVVPWTWHNKLGKRVIPLTIRNLKFYAGSAALLGVFILYCIFQPMFR